MAFLAVFCHIWGWNLELIYRNRGTNEGKKVGFCEKTLFLKTIGGKNIQNRRRINAEESRNKRQKFHRTGAGSS